MADHIFYLFFLGPPSVPLPKRYDHKNLAAVIQDYKINSCQAVISLPRLQQIKSVFLGLVIILGKRMMNRDKALKTRLYLGSDIRHLPVSESGKMSLMSEDIFRSPVLDYVRQPHLSGSVAVVHNLHWRTG